MDEDELKQALTQQLQSLYQSGVRTLPSAQTGSQPLELTDLPGKSVTENAAQYLATAEVGRESLQTDAQPKAASKSFADNTCAGALSADDRIHELGKLQNQVMGCITCPELVKSRSQTVFGVGNPEPRLCFFGEGPGFDEDQQGEPFVGKSGKLLNRIINACKMEREDVYILNAVKCRPPNNRNPTENELENCSGFWERQLEILQPEFICCLGSIAARTLLRTGDSVGRLRKQFYEYRGSRVIVTYHPAYVLRNDSARRDVWDDMKMLMGEMGIEV